MKVLRASRLLDVGILGLIVVTARVALAQEAAPPRPVPMRATPAALEEARPRATVPATTPAVPSSVTAPPMAPPSPQADGRIAVQLKDGSRIIGKPVGLESLKFKASFGEIAVPIETILGLKVVETANSTGGVTNTATLLFKNGDVLTAESLLSTLKLDTLFGETALAGKHLDSVVMSTDRMTWINDGKWRLIPEGVPGVPSYGPPPSTLSPYTPPGADPFGPPTAPVPGAGAVFRIAPSFPMARPVPVPATAVPAIAVPLERPLPDALPVRTVPAPR